VIIFPHFLLKTGFVICSGNNSFELQWEVYSAVDTIAASLFTLSVGWLAAMSYLQQTPHELETTYFGLSR
jgi:hypothetical protein